ncbi:MAG TPA: hypothetical protein GX011_07795 [Clostridiales bacterium]|jgi:hypothetical protein|nr:hypothetical protein [Clostridiales bacterium]
MNSDHEIIIANLDEIWERQRGLNRLRISQAYEILNQLAPSMRLAGSTAEAIGTAAACFGKSELLKKFSSRDRILICRRLSEMLGSFGFSSDELLFNHPDTPNGTRVAYVINRYSAEAFRIFSSHLPGAQPRIYNSFTEMCEGTASGKADACVIPIENTSDGKLLSFYSLIERFDLKTSALCDITNEDDTKRTRYALLCRHIIRPAAGTREGCDSIFFEFSFSPTPGITLDEILHAIVLCGLNIYRIDSAPLRYNESNFIFHIVLLGSLENIITYTVFLTLCLAQYTPIGVCRLLGLADENNPNEEA